MAPDELVIAAGSAFGSGAHPSTALSLQLLQGIAQARHDITNIIDIGCGSGILSIAAAKHWPQAHIVASDIKESVPDFVKHNAALNEVQTRITALRADGLRHVTIQRHAPYDLVLCNMLAERIITWLPELAQHTQQDGLIVIAGILGEFEASCRERAMHCGLEIVTVLAQQNWRAMILRHAPEAQTDSLL